MKSLHCYYVIAQRPLLDASIKPLLVDVLGSRLSWQRLSPEQLIFFSQDYPATSLQTFLDTYHQENNIKLHLLKTYRIHALGEKASKLAIQKNPGKVDTLGDFILQLMLEGNHALIPLIHQEFSSIPRHLMQTASMLIASDMNATQASERLYVHRNTFAYRLNQFINLTGLDVRQHDHALLFTLVEKILMQKS